MGVVRWEGGREGEGGGFPRGLSASIHIRRLSVLLQHFNPVTTVVSDASPCYRSTELWFQYRSSRRGVVIAIGTFQFASYASQAILYIYVTYYHIL